MEWKEIPNSNGKYLISEAGDIISTISGKRLTAFTTREGYLRIELNLDGIASKYYVHRLVAETFIPNPNSLPVVNHKDENPLNNNVSNLEWCTYQYNTNYGTCIERRVEHTDFKRGEEHPSSKYVYQFDMQGNLIGTYGSTQEAARKTGLNAKSIAKACSGGLKKYSECVWSYNNEFHYDDHKHYENRKGIICMYDLAGNLIKEYGSPDEMRADGLNPANVNRVCRGERKTYNNYIFTVKTDT